MIGQIEERRERIESGDGRQLLEALLDVCMSNAPMPNWLSFRLAGAVRKYTDHEAKTLDEAFNVQRPKNYHHQSKKRRRQAIGSFYVDVLTLRAAGVPIDDELFAAVGDLYKIKRTTASEWYVDRQKVLGNLVTMEKISSEDLSDRLKVVYDSLKPRKGRVSRK